MRVTVTKSSDLWRTAPWVVRYYVRRKPVRRFFETKEDAEQHAREVRETVRSGADPRQIAEANRLIAGTGLDMASLIRAGLDYIRNSGATALSPTATFSDGVKMVFANAVHCRSATIAGYRSKLRQLERVFGSRVAASITNADVQTYLDQLADRRGVVGNATPDTKQTMLRHIRMVLRAIGMTTPLPRLLVNVPRVREIRFFSIDELRTILSAAEARDRGFVALALFAAIRPQTVERLPAECVKPADKLIRIPGELSKDHRPHFLETVPIGTDREMRPGPPDALWDWLARYPFEPRRWAPIQRRLRRALGGRWIHDGLRHSGATYYRAKYGAAATAELLTHVSIKMVNQHYAGVVTRAEADRFFGITPASVGDLEVRKVSVVKRVNWPKDDQLAAMLSDMPATEVARRLGCSDSMVAKHCRKRRISKPARGAWTNVSA